MRKASPKPKRKIKGIWIPILIWRLKIKGMLPVHRCLLAEIDSLSSPGDPCKAGNKYLSDLFQVSIPTISRAISFLHDHKLIRLWYEKSGNQGRRMEAINPYQNDKALYQNDKALDQNDKDRKPLDRIINNTNPKVDEKKTNLLEVEEQILSGSNENNRETSPQVPPRPPSKRRKSVLFSDTKYADFDEFKSAFCGSKYEVADLEYYWEAIKNWSEGDGKKKVDWISTARSWMLRDRKEGKLVMSENSKLIDDGKKIIDLGQASRVAEIRKNRRRSS